MGSEKTELIDWSVYGSLLRNRRMKAGFRSMDDFLQALWFRTRVKVSKDTMYKIEQGKVAPSIEVYWGINLLLFGTRNNNFLIQMAVCDEWNEAEEYYEYCAFRENCFDLSRPYVSETWANENRKEARDYAVKNNLALMTSPGMGVPVRPDENLSPEECSELTDEPIPVFKRLNDWSRES